MQLKIRSPIATENARKLSASFVQQNNDIRNIPNLPMADKVSSGRLITFCKASQT